MNIEHFAAEAANPLVPSAGDVVLGVTVPVVAIALFVWALVTVFKADWLSASARLIWGLFVLVCPVVGSVAWLAYRLYRRRGQRSPAVS